MLTCENEELEFTFALAWTRPTGPAEWQSETGNKKKEKKKPKPNQALALCKALALRKATQVQPVSVSPFLQCINKSNCTAVLLRCSRDTQEAPAGITAVAGSIQQGAWHQGTPSSWAGAEALLKPGQKQSKLSALTETQPGRGSCPDSLLSHRLGGREAFEIVS